MTARRPHLRAVPTPPEQPVAPVQLLNWRHSSHFGQPAPYVLCGTTTPLRSHPKEPVHKVCAELWNEAHPGETRFVSDPPKGQRDHRLRLNPSPPPGGPHEQQP